MSFVINTNTLSLTAQQNLGNSQKSLNSAIERLSSGSQINSAKDDAAGQAISNRMTSQINGLSQASSNANDGISLAQTAEGALNQVNDNLQRVRELTVQAQNGTNSASDIDSIQQEVNARLEEIDRVTKQTEFNGISVLNNTEETGTNFSIQVGADDGQTIDIKMDDSSGWNLKESGTTTEAGGLTEVQGEERGEPANGFDVRSVVSEEEAAEGGAYADMKQGENNALRKIDDALKAVDEQRSSLGAVQNRLDSAINNISTTEINISSAQSRISDADYATEVSNMSKAQILQQAGTSVLAQANQTTQGVLSLLG